MQTFIGIDLAWQSQKNHTGLAAFRGDADGAELVATRVGVTNLSGVIEFVQDHRTDTTVVAIDAPLIVHNLTGQRPCEKEVSQRFSRAHASAHSSNLTRHPEPGGVYLAERLTEIGFRHCSPPGETFLRSGSWFFEVYPHPAHVVLFARNRIIKYKKGRVADRRKGLVEFRNSLRKYVFGNRPSLRLNEVAEAVLVKDILTLRGQALKRYEDTLDAFLCCYLAFHLWRWGWLRSEMIGDMESGYIVNPTTQPGERFGRDSLE